MLLVATVALSAALIAAVSAAMNSMQASAKRQVETTVGASDARIRASGTGKTIDASLLGVARSWPEVEIARGSVRSPVTLAARLDILEPNGSSGFRRARTRYTFSGVATASPDGGANEGLSLTEGRWPTGADEIAIDASLAVRLSHDGAASRSPFDLPARRGGQREHLRGPHPEVPDATNDSAEADRINRLVGVRVGDRIEIVRQTMPDVDLSKVLADPVKAAELARAAGVTPSLPNLADLFRRPVVVRIVGVVKPPPFGGRARVFLTPDTMTKVTGTSDQLSEISLSLRPSVDAEAFVRERQTALPKHVLIQSTAKVTARLDQSIEASRLGFLLATAMAFLCAAFIITTAMTTSIAERLREFGVLRSIGASPGQLARAQLVTGVLIGSAGAAVGVPLGLLIAWALVQSLRNQVEVSLILPLWGVAFAACGAVLSGLAGALIPAWRAARISPLEALAARSVQPRVRGVATLLVVGLALAALHLGVITFTRDGQTRFWLYIFLGLPALFVGYFLIAVPVTAFAGRVLSPGVSRLLSLPSGVLGRTLRATPYRYGFTSGSMMMGMALMVGIWTQGGAIQRDWLGKLEFPDAFVAGFNITPGSQDLLNGLASVERTCAITMHPIEADAFGVKPLQSFKSTFMAFEPEAFFAMVKPVWIQGDQANAIARLNEGGAVIVAREFMVTQGLGVGDTFRCRANGVEHAFEIVGVVTSPGLEVVSQFFSIGEGFTEQSMHAVFGSRSDLKERFGSDAIHLIQIELSPDADDRAALAQIREVLAGAGILDAGSGRAVKAQIEEFVRGGLFAASLIAVVSMLIAGFGVANLIIAGITARQFEFGVLRAVGAGRGLVARLVMAEALVVGISAAATGTLMGLQGVYAVQRIDELLFGLDLRLRPPPVPLLVGWTATILMTLAAAAPAVIALSRKGPRELLASMKG